LILQKDEFQVNCAELAQYIFNAGNRLSSFLNDMLLLAKMEHGQLLLNCAPVDINQFVQELVQHHHLVARSKKITFKLEVPPVSKQVSLDANLMHRVVDNLIGNALKYAPSTSTITIQVEYPSPTGPTSHQPPQFRLRVLDEGPGVPVEYRDKIFEKFGTLDLKDKGVTQTGLGLTFSKMAVEAHGGRVYVAGNRPQGAIFTIEI
jgi:signal transduction histidine kinase